MATFSADDLGVLIGVRPATGIARWLHAGVRAAIADSRLPPGTALPSGRDVALHLRISRGTVVAAFDLLVSEGLLISKPRSALTVAPGPGGVVRPSPPVVERTAVASPGSPDPALFPRAAWGNALRETTRLAPHSDFGYPDPQGLPRLREAVADYLRLSRGAVAEPERVVIVGGVAQALVLLGTVLKRRGATHVAVEEPGSAGAIGTLKRAGLGICPTPVDELGLRPDLLDPAATAVLLTPAHQFPMGVVLAPQRRRALVSWASRDQRLLIEDDYDAELRYDRLPVPVLQAANPDTVVLTGSVSKTLSPGLRLGWLLLPPDLVDEVVTEKWHADLGCSMSDQAALAELLTNGTYQRHIRRVRRIYQDRRAALLKALSDHCPQVTVTGISAGLHLVLSLEDSEAEQRAITSLLQQDVSAQPLSSTFHGPPRFGVVLGTARTKPEAIAGLARVLSLLKP